MNDDSAERQAQKRRGRKYSEVRASTEEYARLVGFLRRQMNRAGLRQTDLANVTGVSKSAISERLQGTRLTLDFVEAVVTACTSAPHLALRRDKDLAEARRLWALTQKTRTPVLRMTDQPTAIRNVAVEAQRRTLDAQDKVIELQDELIRKQEQLSLTERARRGSEQALFAATALAGLLSAWVIVLADEVEQLTRERDESMQIRPPDLSRLATLDPELAMKIAQEQRTSTELRKVEQERDIAQAVLTESISRGRSLHRDILRLHQAIESAAEASGTADLATMLDSVAVPSALGADIEEALARAEGISELISEQLRVALIDLGEAPELRNAHFPAPENAPVGQRAPDNPWWWDVIVDVPGKTFAWAERTATELLDARDPHDPLITEVVTTHPVREALLLADTLVRNRWLEGATRIHVVLAMTLGVETLADLIPALLKGPRYTQRPELGNRLLHVSLAYRSTSEALRLYNRFWLSHSDYQARNLGAGSLAGRSRADVTDILRKQLSDNPRVLTDSPFLNTIVRDWPPAEVIELIEELTDEPEGENFTWQVFHSLPTPPAAFTELILHLWVAVPKVFFDELIPLMYGGDQSSGETAAIIIGLHQEWEPPLDSAARELIDRVIPVIINQTPIGDFEHIGLYLYQAGINVEEIFAPYRQSFQINFGHHET